MTDVTYIGPDSDTVFTITRTDALTATIKVYDIEYIDALHIRFGDLDHLMKAIKMFIDESVA